VKSREEFLSRSQLDRPENIGPDQDQRIGQSDVSCFSPLAVPCLACYESNDRADILIPYYLARSEAERNAMHEQVSQLLARKIDKSELAPNLLRNIEKIIQEANGIVNFGRESRV